MSDFKKGDQVRYIPCHANGDPKHPDCENGVVSSLSSDGVSAFVKYDNPMCVMVTGNEDYTAQSTRFSDLVKR